MFTKSHIVLFTILKFGTVEILQFFKAVSAASTAAAQQKTDQNEPMLVPSYKQLRLFGSIERSLVLYSFVV